MGWAALLFTPQQKFHGIEKSAGANKKCTGGVTDGIQASIEPFMKRVRRCRYAL